MKKHLWIINLILLVINILLFLYFTVYIIIGSYPVGNYIRDNDISMQLIIALVYEFCFVFVSIFISKVLKKDLSFKGTDVLKFTPKIITVVISIIAFALVLYTLVSGISAEFAVMVVVMLFSILLELCITIMLNKN